MTVCNENFRIFHPPNLRSPPPTIFTNSTANETTSCRTQPGLLLCFLFLWSGEMKDILWKFCSFWTVERDAAGKATFFLILFFVFVLLKPDWTDGSQSASCKEHTNSRTVVEVHENSSVPIYNYLKKTTVTWKEKSWKKFVKCLNIWLSFHY